VNSAVPAPVSRVVARLLEKNPENRYPTAGEALEELDAARGVRSTTKSGEIGTVAAQFDEVASSHLPTVIDDRHLPLIRRHIPATLFWVITLALAGALGGTIVILRQDIVRQRPSAVIAPKLAEETRAKRRALVSAHALAEAGRYEEAISSYDAYIARYPQSVAAHEQRAEVQAMMEEAKAKTEITKVGRKPRAEPAKTDAPKPAGKWQRFKRWFRGK
jgi:hypothetical protein